MEIKMRIYLIFSSVLFLSFSGFTGTNERVLKMHSDENIGEVTLSKETMFADSRGVGKTYHIDVKKDTKYFIGVVANGVAGKEYDVTIDDRSFVEGKTKLTNGWLASFVAEPPVASIAKAIHLSKGCHKISFIGKGPEVPFVECIRIAETESEAHLTVQDLVSKEQTLASNKLPADYLAKNRTGL